jgi:alpha-beta hydrolase superfamily lysophospholipase
MEAINNTVWFPDILPGFEAATLQFPDDYDGPVTATLVRRPANQPTQRAVLYVPGWTDYFFHVHLADEFNAHGYNFYALDLRKYGRSLAGVSHPNYCRNLHEYFPEISTALQILTEQEGNQWVVINAHSTGGLTSVLYADQGPESHRISALVLNSPFFDFNLDRRELILIKTMASLAGVFPYLQLPSSHGPVPYMESIHADHHGEWSFNLQWRPLHGLPIYASWLRATLQAQRQLRRGLAIQCPVLVLHSSASVRGEKWNTGFQSADSVLNVEHIRQGSRYLGPNAVTCEVKDGMHDLVLSRADVRAQVFTDMFHWLDAIKKGGTDEQTRYNA